MIRLCINCDTENPFEAVICSECGMSLTRAPTGGSGAKLREEMKRARSVVPAAQPAPGQRIRRIARAVALIWAGLWTFLVVAVLAFLHMMSTIDTFPRPSPDLEWWLMLVFMVSVAWVPTAVGWRWEAIGGVLLVALGLLVFPLAAWVYLYPWLGGFALLVLAPLLLDPVLAGFALLFFAGLPLAAGTLFLASWRKSRASRDARRLGAHMIRRHLTGELSKADLEGANAEGANLEGAILPGASLVGANLTRANLSFADLTSADLEGANLERAELERAILVGTRLVGANLRRANLSFADLRSSDLGGANLEWANLEGAILLEARLAGAILRSANLTAAGFKGSDLSNAFLFRANVQGADLESANLVGASLEGADLKGALLAGAKLNDHTIMPEGWEDIVASKPEDEPL